MAKPTKNSEVLEDDLMRRLVTFHYDEAAKEAGVEIKPKDKAPIVEAVCEEIGGAIHDTVRGVCDLLFRLGDDSDDEEEEEEEESK